MRTIVKNIILILPFIISACGASGVPYSAADSVKTINQKMSKLIIYRPSSLGLMARTPDVEINGNKACELPNGSFFSREYEPQNINLTVQLWDMPSTSKISINTKAGKVYYVRISSDGGKIAAGVAAGFVGLAIAEGVSSHAGPFVIDLLDEQAAIPELKNLNMSNNCQ